MQTLRGILLIIALTTGHVAHAQWSTHSHETPAFRIDYPTGWEVQTGQAPENETVGDLLPRAVALVIFRTPGAEGRLQVAVAVHEAADISADALRAALQAQSERRQVQVGRVNDLPCVWYQEGDDERTRLHTYLPRTLGLYRVSLDASAAVFEQCLPGYQHMLMSLREGEAPEEPEAGPIAGADPQEGETVEREGPDGSMMVFVPAGEFIMGALDDDRSARQNEKPAHRVWLSAFWIDKTEVTNAQYAAFLAHVTATGDHSRCHPDEPPNKDHTPARWTDPEFNSPDQPVVGVDWFDAYAYAAWAGKRLPTEAEWEKAARGTDARRYPWGNEWDPRRVPLEGPPAPVGRYPQGASPYGALDMAGNVWEWCADWHERDYYAKSPPVNPRGPERGVARVARGGSRLEPVVTCRTTYRDAGNPQGRGPDRGFRCAMDAE